MAAVMRTAVYQLTRLSLGCSAQGVRAFTCQSGPLAFRATETLSAEPMKKKKKVDPGLLIQRESKKKRKLEKEIKKIDRKGRTLKPVEEIEGYLDVIKTKDQRIRPAVTISPEEEERRALLLKEWSRYKLAQHKKEKAAIRTALRLQAEALEELREESEELYQEAIQIREDLIPYSRSGPVNTPAILDYYPPDGEYIDTTKVYDK